VPLIGFKCDLDNEPVSFADCVACAGAVIAPKGTRCRFTASVLASLADNASSRTGLGISATGLCGCLRQSYLNLTQPYYHEPIKLWPAYRGTLFHALFERSQVPGLVRERRLVKTLLGMSISGQPDEIDPARELLIDYKTVDRVPDTVQDRYIAQMNIYKWLLSDGVDMETGEIINIPITQAGIQFVTMKDVTKLPVPLWSLEETEAWDVAAYASYSCGDA
jgi:hypothetical protein